MRYGLWLVVLHLTGAAAPACGQAPRLQAPVERVLKEEGLVGAVWSTVHPERGIQVGAAGRADARRPLAATSRVQVGSVAKTLAAVGMLRLVREGRVALDGRVDVLLPDVRIDNPWADTHPLRVRHLLDHTAGLDDARLWQIFSREAAPDAPLGAAFPRASPPLRLRTRPGTRFSYSNTGYTLLGMIIEAATGERYESYLDRHLLQPLGMTNSTFRFVSQAADPRLAMGHFEDSVPQASVPLFLRPASQFTTTAGDMARFAEFLMGDGKTGGVQVAGAELLRAMGTPASTEAASAGLRAGYGLGLGRRDRQGTVGLCHSGNTVGYHAMLCIYPQERKAFFVSANADVEDAEYDRLDRILTDALGVRRTTPAPASRTALELAEWEGIYVPSPSRFASFAYLDVVLGFAALRHAGGSLHLTPFQGRARELIPAGGALFRRGDRTAPSHALFLDTDGARALSDGNQTYEKIGRWCIVPLWISAAGGVLGLVYLLVAGLARIARRSLTPGHPVFAPFAGVLLLIAAAALFMRQSLLHLGDSTLANVSLAAATGALPLALLFGLWRQRASRRRGLSATLDAFAMAGVLQWAAVLAWWNLVPLRLWA
ncbi:MAG: D-alanyl-D-alanine carboxypeptidase [uncultured Gemmatimonadetes bacterium]|uniref:D-alanyl-D-alanine carboxypeptidase n=1 Tax=uncultured Gemmatimonadota bacterium TaxID=203437 RepID=A0A6J4MWJ6_9BACT|nr:MAG: D-alanyl-D-alanine carboxypeptidase [uncultured Gemmatimonadota bacterium]